MNRSSYRWAYRIVALWNYELVFQVFSIIFMHGDVSNAFLGVLQVPTNLTFLIRRVLVPVPVPMRASLPELTIFTQTPAQPQNILQFLGEGRLGPCVFF